jgi:hypothetical protein
LATPGKKAKVGGDDTLHQTGLALPHDPHLMPSQSVEPVLEAQLPPPPPPPQQTPSTPVAGGAVSIASAAAVTPAAAVASGPAPTPQTPREYSAQLPDAELILAAINDSGIDLIPTESDSKPSGM